MNLAEYILLAVGSLFVIIDPLALVPLFLAMTPRDTPAQRIRTAGMACAVAAGVLIAFALIGQWIFKFLGITLPAFQMAGSVVLFLISVGTESKPCYRWRATLSSFDPSFSTAMPDEPPIAIQNPPAATLDRADLPRLFEALHARGFAVVGPTVRDGAIVYDSLAGPEQLPAGWTDEQDGGKYRLKKRNDAALFGYVVGPHSWKKFLFPAEQRLFSAQRTGSSFEVRPETVAAPKLAFLGVRSCELHAIAIQDKVFVGGKFVDPAYQARRRNVFIIAVNCGQAGGTCFCVSMKTGPKAASGFDLALTEILDGARHYFVIESGSDAGAEVLAELPSRSAEVAELSLAAEATARATAQMGRTMDTTGIRELLYRNLEHPRWDDVADRCLSCANCTMACPTCFCSNVEDVTDLTGEHAERWRKWDSCFTIGFSHIAGGAVRSSVKSRYRQWLTHKLATWIDQFGTSGCVGCGRCITWCPVAIDLTEEVRVIRETEPSTA